MLSAGQDIGRSAMRNVYIDAVEVHMWSHISAQGEESY